MSRECDKKECFANVNGICDALTSAIVPDCPFFKTEVQAVLENGALTASPADWKAFRKFSGTKLPKAEELAAWLFKLEEIKPTDDPDVTAKLKALFGGSDAFVLKSEVIEKMTAALMEEGKWLSPYGLAGERLDSDHYHESGWSAGPVLGPAQLLVCLGLHFAGREKEAREVSLRYCRALKNANFPMVINPKTGLDVSEGRWGAKYPNRMAWTACVFNVLCSMYSL